MDFWNRLISEGDHAAREARERARAAVCDESTGRGWTDRLIVACAAGLAGAAAAMLLDPARGRGRRARLVDQGGAMIRRGARELSRFGRRVSSDVEGKLSAARAARDPSTAPMDDVTITDRVESELFRDPTIPKGTMNINVERGTVVLRGEVPSDEMRRHIVDRVERIDGVWSVRSLLHLPGEPAPHESIPSIT